MRFSWSQSIECIFLPLRFIGKRNYRKTQQEREKTEDFLRQRSTERCRRGTAINNIRRTTRIRFHVLEDKDNRLLWCVIVMVMVPQRFSFYSFCAWATQTHTPHLQCELVLARTSYGSNRNIVSQCETLRRQNTKLWIFFSHSSVYCYQPSSVRFWCDDFSCVATEWTDNTSLADLIWKGVACNEFWHWECWSSANSMRLISLIVYLTFLFSEKVTHRVKSDENVRSTAQLEFWMQTIIIPIRHMIAHRHRMCSGIFHMCNSNAFNTSRRDISAVMTSASSIDSNARLWWWVGVSMCLGLWRAPLSVAGTEALNPSTFFISALYSHPYCKDHTRYTRDLLAISFTVYRSCARGHKPYLVSSEKGECCHPQKTCRRWMCVLYTDRHTPPTTTILIFIGMAKHSDKKWYVVFVSSTVRRSCRFCSNGNNNNNNRRKDWQNCRVTQTCPFHRFGCISWAAHIHSIYDRKKYFAFGLLYDFSFAMAWCFASAIW